MHRHAPKLLLFCVLILALFLRTYHLASAPPGLYPDEAMNGNNAAEVIATGDAKVFYPENNGREGLFINIQALSLWIFGEHEPWVLRLPSSLIGALTVLGMYFLARELFASASTEEGTQDARRYGLLAAFLLATSTWHLVFSRMGFRAIMAPLMLVWTLYLVLCAMRTLRSTEHWKKALPWVIGAATVYGLGFYTYIAFRLTPLLLLVPLVSLLCALRGRAWKPLVVFCIASVIVAAPLGLYFLQHPEDLSGRSEQLSVWNGPHPWQSLASNTARTFGMLFYKGDGNWRHNVAGVAELWLPVAILFGIGLLLCICRLAWTRKTPLRYVLCLVWLVVGLIPGIISNEGIPHSLRSILALPAVILIATLGGMWLYDLLSTRASRRVLLAALGVFVLLASFQAYRWYFFRWAIRPVVHDAFSSDYVEVGRIINALPREREKYVVVSPSSVEVLGLPVRAQTTMFITDTFDPEKAAVKNVHYVAPGDLIPEGAAVFKLP